MILEKLYEGEDGYQIHADDLWFEDIAEDLKLGDYRTPIRILDTLAELKLISSQLWAEHIIYSDAIAERGDSYILKRAKEADKKRRQRRNKKHHENVKKRKCPLGTSEGQGDKTSDSDKMSPTDPDPYSDLHTEENTKKINSRSSETRYTKLRDLYLQEKPPAWKGMGRWGTAISKMLAKRLDTEIKAVGEEAFWNDVKSALVNLRNDSFYGREATCCCLSLFRSGGANYTLH